MVATIPPASQFDIRPEIMSLQPDLVGWRRELHKFPELGFREKRTATLIANQLSSWGIPHQIEIAHTGIVATIVGTKTRSQTLSSSWDIPLQNPEHPVFAIRADIDALPIQEENIISYRSQIERMMHACGHDGHTAIALGTAYSLWQNRDRLAGTVKIIFQPAEEGPGGAKPMIEAGVLKNPDVDAIVGLHLWNNLPLGTAGVRTGALMAAVEFFDCKILGQGGHGAMPHQTVDSILVAAQVVNALQAIVSRNVDPLDAAVITVGQLHGGSARNIIADTTSLSGTVRYFNPELATLLPQRIEQAIAGVCQSQGARYELDYQKIYPPVINDGRVANLVRAMAKAAIEPAIRLSNLASVNPFSKNSQNNTQAMPTQPSALSVNAFEQSQLGIVPECRTMGGEDMSYFLEAIPGCYFFLGSANAERNLTYPHHHPKFDFDETALAAGVEIFVRCAEAFCS